jgi:hypothetical protein
MKTFLLFLLSAIICSTQAQSLSPTVISSSGDYFTGTGGSLSWTLGEIATETLINGGNILMQGFQQPVEGISINIDLDLLVFLEGPFTTAEMTTSLNAAGLIPNTQPYNSEPWNYTGTESVSSIPNPQVTDWVLVELRDAPNASSATPETRLARQAAFLLKDGSIVGKDGSSILQFNAAYTQQLFVIIWHRNHLGIMSANGVAESGGIYIYDFSIAETQVYGGSNGYNSLTGGVWGMTAGDATHDGIVNLQDKNEWASFAGQRGYLDTDISMDAQVNNVDKNDKMLENDLKQSQVPQ